MDLTAAEQHRALRQYMLVTGNYWAFTLTDGALRMLVVLYFHQLGYGALQIALLFLFYEFFGVVTNLLGGWLGARAGLNRTMNMGLALQILALMMLVMPDEWLTVGYVMAAQALSGIAKDLNKMSAKSSVKLLIEQSQQQRLFRWVAWLTGSKNALKGVGFFIGGGLLTVVGFQGAMLVMAGVLTLILVGSLFFLNEALGKSRSKPKFKEIFSKSRAVNLLSAARLFLFSARDVWFVVALPVFLSEQLQWSYESIGAFLAVWIIGYGGVQALAPRLTRKSGKQVADGRDAVRWIMPLALIPVAIAGAMTTGSLQLALILGLSMFAAVFALNSSLHSYLILSYASEDGVSLDVGFYYMANAAGRLFGTLAGGWAFQGYGLEACLMLSSVFLVVALLFSLGLPKHSHSA